MAVLIIEHRGTRRGAVLPRRVLIGRRSMNHLVLDDRTVSRMHAWISGRGERYRITDANSRTGTRVNGRPIYAAQLLQDGDEITIGPARLTYRRGGQLPPDVQTIDLSADPILSPDDKGILFDCACGAPLWASLSFMGHSGQCSYCSRAITVPRARTPAEPASPRARTPIAPPPPIGVPEAITLPEPTARVVQSPRAGPLKPKEICGVCQSTIGAFEERTSCPSCGLTFHAECWAENYGCSAYGCAQVNALAPMPLAEEDTAPISTDEIGEQGDPDVVADVPVNAMPWEFVLLAASVFGVLLGAVSFGLPSLLAAGGSVAYLARHRGKGRTGVVLAAAALALVGIVAGVAVSWVLYFHAKSLG